MKFFIASFALHLILCYGLPWEQSVVIDLKDHVEQEEENIIRELYDIGGIKHSSKIGSFLDAHKVEKNYKLVKISGHNCGSSSDLIYVNSLNIPDEIIFGQNATFSVDASIRKTIKRPTLLKVKVQRVGVPFDIPCIDNFGTCNYTDPCHFLDAIKVCPPEITKTGWNCKCPLLKREFSIPDTTIKVPKISLPSFLINGSYDLHIQLYDASGELLCYQLTVTLKEQ